MSKQLSQTNFNAILETVTLFPEGASSNTIFQTLLISQPRRSLQRYLTLLLKEGKLTASGNARSKKYHLPIKEVYLRTYERPSVLYSATRKNPGEHDLFRFTHRNLLSSMVGEIIRGHMDKQKAIAAIEQKATTHVAMIDQAQFIETMGKILIGLHMGNIARFRISPTEYESWVKTWH